MNNKSELIENELLDAFLKELDNGARPTKTPVRAAMHKLKQHILRLRKENYTDLDIANYFSEKLQTRISRKAIEQAMGDKIKIKNTLASTHRHKKVESSDASVAAESDVSYSESADRIAPESANGGETADADVTDGVAELENIEVRTLENVQQWREDNNSVVLKETVPVKAGVRIKTPSGRIAEVVACKPCTYGGGFSRRDGMEVSYKLL